MNGVSTAFWSLLLAGSAMTIGVGFAGGRTYAHTSLAPRPLRTAQPLPEDLHVRALARALRGADSFDVTADDRDPYGDVDDAVASRPAGWAPRRFDDRTGRPRIAVIVVDADREATALAAFAHEPFRLTILVPPAAARETLQIARDGQKPALLACEDVAPADVAAARRAGAVGIACSTGDPLRAKALVAANGDGVVLDDRLDDDGLYRAARAAGRPAFSRDVTADARETDAYAAFLFAQAQAIAERTGVATVAVHARDDSRQALERFVARAQRDGVEFVDVAAL